MQQNTMFHQSRINRTLETTNNIQTTFIKPRLVGEWSSLIVQNSTWQQVCTSNPKNARHVGSRQNQGLSFRQNHTGDDKNGCFRKGSKKIAFGGSVSNEEGLIKGTTYFLVQRGKSACCRIPVHVVSGSFLAIDSRWNSRWDLSCPRELFTNFTIRIPPTPKM